ADRFDLGSIVLERGEWHGNGSVRYLSTIGTSPSLTFSFRARHKRLLSAHFLGGGVSPSSKMAKGAPAYKGARFDADGFCVAHPGVRLCRSTAEGNYKRCGKQPRSNRDAAADSSKANAGERRGDSGRRATKGERGGDPNVPVRSRRSESFNRNMAAESSTANAGERGGADAGRRATKCERGRGQNVPPGSRRSKSLRKKESGRSKSRTQMVSRSKSRTRGRTISPPRRPLEKIPKRPSSSSEARKKKVTDEKIATLRTLLPPIGKPSRDSRSSKRDGRFDRAAGGRGDGDDARHLRKTKLPFDRKGFCRAHPAVRLARKNDRGEWEVVSGVCPQCCASAVIAYKEKESSSSGEAKVAKPGAERGPADDFEGLSGEVVAASEDRRRPERASAKARTSEGGIVRKASDGSHTHPTSTSSSYPSSPDSVSKPAFSAEYFTTVNRKGIIGMLLDIYEGEKMVAELNASCFSETTVKHGNVVCVRRDAPCDPPRSREPPGRRL
ncbi:hypothetical protein ACHAWF_009544, partial [Thalassiosira exigua]